MIAYVSGVCVEHEEDAVILDVQGMGYRVFCPYPSKIVIREHALLYTYHYLREDATFLYGFLSRDELNVFLKLITVKGVGPRIGMGVLRKVPYDVFVRAIEEENVAFLKTLPGVGPKMASQIVLDLKGKFVSTSTAQVSENNELQDVYDALSDLGFKRGEINGIKNQLLEFKEKDLNFLIKHALKLLSR